MPNILHNVLTGSEIHEPKGVSTADEGGIYVANGAGSGTWVQAPSGWGHYADDSSEQTFDTTTAKLTINNTGTTAESSYLPLAIRGTSELWDTSSNKITPIKAGDAYSVRLFFPVTARTTAKYLTLDLDIGGGASPSNIIASERLNVDKAAPYLVSTTFTIFTLSTFVTNGGQIFLTVDAGSVGITDPTILISRIHSEIT